MPDGKAGMPCGACREFMMQLNQTAGEIEILCDYETKKVMRLKSLTPEWWCADQMKMNEWGNFSRATRWKISCRPQRKLPARAAARNRWLWRLSVSGLSWTAGSCQTGKRSGWKRLHKSQIYWKPKDAAGKKARERQIGNLQWGEASCNIKYTENKIEMWLFFCMAAACHGGITEKYLNDFKMTFR